ncbi:hypothetical protein N008_08065 [Hymenobacter sp. APR13]|nr:hypothetical protein N008_08065 [Hymenobacter sp. APR13]
MEAADLRRRIQAKQIGSSPNPRGARPAKATLPAVVKYGKPLDFLFYLFSCL